MKGEKENIKGKDWGGVIVVVKGRFRLPGWRFNPSLQPQPLFHLLLSTRSSSHPTPAAGAVTGFMGWGSRPPIGWSGTAIPTPAARTRASCSTTAAPSPSPSAASSSRRLAGSLSPMRSSTITPSSTSTPGSSLSLATAPTRSLAGIGMSFFFFVFYGVDRGGGTMEMLNQSLRDWAIFLCFADMTKEGYEFI